MRTATWLVSVGGLIGVGVVWGCHSEEKTSAKTATVAFTTVDQQIAHGATVFKNECAECHGSAGQGTRKAPPLVGPSALPKMPRAEAKYRKTEFRTAMDVAGFVTKNMPPDAADRKELTEQDYWAVLAFDLSANGVKLQEPVGPGNASAIVLHP